MGCASSAGMVPGAVLESKDGNIIDHAKRMLGQESSKMGDNAMGKLHELGGAVKDKVGNVVEDIEDRVKSMVGGAKSQVETINSDVNDRLESINQGLDGMTDEIDSAAQQIQEAVKTDDNDNDSRPNSAASTAEAASDPFPPSSLDEIKREMESNDMELTEMNGEAEPEETQEENQQENTETDENQQSDDTTEVPPDEASQQQTEETPTS